MAPPAPRRRGGDPDDPGTTTKRTPTPAKPKPKPLPKGKDPSTDPDAPKNKPAVAPYRPPTLQTGLPWESKDMGPGNTRPGYQLGDDIHEYDWFRQNYISDALASKFGSSYVAFEWFAYKTNLDKDAYTDTLLDRGWTDIAGAPPSPGGGPGGGGGRGGGGGGGAGGVPTPEQIAATAAALRNKARTLGIDLDDDSINSLADTVIRNGWTVDMIDDYLTAGLGANPENAQAGTFTANKDGLRQLADAQGVTLDEAALNTWAQRMASGEMDQAGAQSMILAMAKQAHPEAAAALDRGITYRDFTMAMGPAVDMAKKFSSDMLLPIADETAKEWAAKIAGGEWDQAMLQSNIAQLAKTKYAWAAPAIDAGMSVRDFLLPSRDRVANELEMSPNGVDLMDVGWQDMMFVIDEKGGQRLATDYELTQRSRARPEFVRTKKASDKTAELALALRSHFEGTG